jgi:hypothetical protein
MTSMELLPPSGVEPGTVGLRPSRFAFVLCTSLVGAAAFAGSDGGVPLRREPAVSVSRARALLYGATPDAGTGPACDEGADLTRLECLLRARFAADADAGQVAEALLVRSGDVVGLLPEEDFEGGYRGTIHLVPALPAGAERRHLEWTAGALGDFDAFFAKVGAAAPAPLRYRWTGLELRFFRSVGKRTPAAFAQGWAVSYNVNGTLNGSPEQVKNLLFHEVFHLNDADHGGWSWSTLAPLYSAIRARCGAKTACLAPYAPDPLIVYGGTYYSFQPGNDVGEYAADLALRFFKEHRAVLSGAPPAHPFKCGAPENAEAWRLISAEFFGGADLTPPCPRPEPQRLRSSPRPP